MWKKVQSIWVHVPEHFALNEFYPKSEKGMLETYGEQVWAGANPKTTITMDRLRKKYGIAYMNTWGMSEEVKSIYGDHQYRGWRPYSCEVGAPNSQHKEGSAADMVFAYIDAEQVRREVLADPYDETFEFITCIEMEVSWFHFDVRPHDKANKGILQIFP